MDRSFPEQSKQCKSFMTMIKGKNEIIIRRIDRIKSNDENNDVDIDITIHAIIFQPISKITMMFNVNK